LRERHAFEPVLRGLPPELASGPFDAGHEPRDAVVRLDLELGEPRLQRGSEPLAEGDGIPGAGRRRGWFGLTLHDGETVKRG